MTFLEFLDVIGVPAESVAPFVESFSDFESEICDFGYLSQERFEEFVRCFAELCGSVQLYPGMLVFTFYKEGDAN